MSKPQVESALFFETVEQIYERIFRFLRPRSAVPRISVRYRRYANANSRIRLSPEGELTIDISDVLKDAPAPVQEALAVILLSKLYRKEIDRSALARYRRYLNKAETRHALRTAKQQRGRKTIRHPEGRVYDAVAIFEDLNLRYFGGLMARPEIGWSLRPSRTTLGHYDPCHHAIVLSSVLDSAEAPRIAVEFVMFHEMLHLKFPAEHRGARRCVHTPEFKRAEREFAGYEEARKALRKFLER